MTGELGEAIEYGTATRIKTFKDMGYDLIQDEFPKDAIFDDKDIDDQEWFVFLQHDVAKIGPDHEQVPDTPINPNNPDGPKWPSKYAYEKEVSFTVFYKSTDGNADLPDADVQKAYWSVPLPLTRSQVSLLTRQNGHQTRPSIMTSMHQLF